MTQPGGSPNGQPSGTWDPARQSPYMHWRDELGGQPPCGAVTDKVVRIDPDLMLGTPYGVGEALPMPVPVANPDDRPLHRLVPQGITDLVPQAPPRDAVILGIIDEAIALGHPRFRRADGRSRVLAAWQQGATFDPAQGAYLPLGNEVYQRDLDQWLQQFSDGGDPRQTLDEVAFNRAARLSEPQTLYGVEALDRRAGHGSAVLDLATGEDLWRSDPAQLDRRPILAATLPRRETIGMAGTYLEFFAIYAMFRMVALADAIWQANYGPDGGYPIVLNMSYGQQAGPKDGRSNFEKAVQKLSASRPAGAPLQVVMPAGNDNLMRCNALRKVRRNGYFKEKWRLQPDDHSSNFVEVWTGRTTRRCDRNPLEIRVIPPDFPAPRGWSGSHGEYLDVPGGARIYCERVRYNGDLATPEYRYRYVICTPPTAPDLRETGITRIARAGPWCVRLQNRGADSKVYMNVQVDQSAEPHKLLNKRSYLDSDRYRQFLDNGRWRDSFAYPIDPDNPDAADLEPYQTQGHVQRKGTVNALSVTQAILTVGSYRVLDGAPVDFSATAGVRRPQQKITASFPGDDGAAHGGLLAAGTTGGSILTPRGTSFSAARASRYLVTALLQGQSVGDAVTWMQDCAAADDAQITARTGAAHPLKIGHGRVQDPARDRAVSRL